MEFLFRIDKLNLEGFIIVHSAFSMRRFCVVPARSNSSSSFAVGLTEKPAIIIHFFVAISTEFKIEISLKFVSLGRKRR